MQNKKDQRSRWKGLVLVVMKKFARWFEKVYIYLSILTAA